MGKDELRNRDVWQDYSGVNAGIAERHFFNVFSTHFKDSDFRVRAKPNEMQDIYVQFPLSQDVLSEIYTPEFSVTKHGITPDYAIDNMRSGKTL
jgi:hypothetical protein